MIVVQRVLAPAQPQLSAISPHVSPQLSAPQRLQPSAPNLQPCLTSASAQCSSSPAAMPPTVAAQHILLKGGDIDARSVAAEAIKTKIEAGDTTFEAAAREFSECPSRAETPAGSLGTFEPGKMVAAFDAYVFNPA